MFADAVFTDYSRLAGQNLIDRSHVLVSFVSLM